MQRHHTGSGRRRAVPATWGADHAAVAASTRNATGTLRRPANGDDASGWDPTTRTTTPATEASYAAHVTARIQSMVTNRADNARIVAEDTIITASYLVAVDHDVAATEGDEFTVETCRGDLPLVGRILRVDHVVRGTDRAERDLYCNLLEPQPA